MKKVLRLLEAAAVIGGLGIATQAHAQTAAASAAAPAPVAAAPAAEAAVAPAPGPEAAPVAAAPAPVAVAPAPAPVSDLAYRDRRRMPRRMKYHEGDPVPEGYVLNETPMRGLMTGGIIAIGVPYLTGLVIGGVANFENQGGWIAIPVAGPWLTWGLRKRDCFNTGCDAADNQAANQLVRTMLVLDGAIQGIGLAMTIMGVVFTRTELLRSDLATVQTILPTKIGREGYGFAATGTF